MASLSRLILALFLCLPLFAHANFPAKPMKNGFCSSTNGSNYQCLGGVTFDSPLSAGDYGCQRYYNSDFHALSASGLPSDSSISINSIGTMAWSVTCTGPGATGPLGYTVVNLPDCQGTGSPILSYNPATCAGSPPPSPSTGCAALANVTVTGYVVTPSVIPNSCSNLCQFGANTTTLTQVGDESRQAGSWVGTGNACGSEPMLILTSGVGSTSSSGGSVDVSALNKEATQQQVLSALNSLAGRTNANGQIDTTNSELQTTNSTLATIAQNTTPDKSDPDGFEAEYTAGVTAHPGGSDATAGLPSSSFDVSQTFANPDKFLGAGSCPAPAGFSVKGHDFKFDLSPLCTLAGVVGYLMVVSSTILGARIFLGGVT